MTKSKYRTIKCSLKSIIKDDFDNNIMFDACFRTHQLIIHTYQFFKIMDFK